MKNHKSNGATKTAPTQSATSGLQELISVMECPAPTLFCDGKSRFYTGTRTDEETVKDLKQVGSKEALQWLAARHRKYESWNMTNLSKLLNVAAKAIPAAVEDEPASDLPALPLELKWNGSEAILDDLDTIAGYYASNRWAEAIGFYDGKLAIYKDNELRHATLRECLEWGKAVIPMASRCSAELLQSSDESLSKFFACVLEEMPKK